MVGPVVCADYRGSLLLQEQSSECVREGGREGGKETEVRKEREEEGRG